MLCARVKDGTLHEIEPCPKRNTSFSPPSWITHQVFLTQWLHLVALQVLDTQEVEDEQENEEQAPQEFVEDDEDEDEEVGCHTPLSQSNINYH